MTELFSKTAVLRAGARRGIALLAAAGVSLAASLLAGCGVSAGPVKAAAAAPLSITPGISHLDTNCTGCNAVNGRGMAVHQFTALFSGGAAGAGASPVQWSVAGGDPVAGPGKIDSEGRYTPPSYLTEDHAEVTVTARVPGLAGLSAGAAGLSASARLTLTPGFLQPLTPENVAVGPGGSITITGKLAQAGGAAGMQFALADSPHGADGGLGTLSAASCQHAKGVFSTCTVTYTAPAALSGAAAAYVVANVAGSTTAAEILLNPAGVTSDPAVHQTGFAALAPLGSSGGNNNDLDAHGNSIADCCSGTLGALVQDGAGRQFVLSNNHVLARSDHAAVGDAIVQPGLIDNNCTPNGDGPGTLPVATLTDWLPLSASETNADAAIAQVGSRTVDGAGSILELGARRSDGTLAAAAPGVSSSGGKGEAAALGMQVAKSGRTTGLTCAGVSAIDLDVQVDYYRDCAETRPYLSKLFTNQVAISGDRFSDAGDSGALVVDTGNAEPVGLLFAGGTDKAGVVHAVANPAPDVVAELSALDGGKTSYTYAGGADHAVSCLDYGNSAVAAAEGAALTDGEIVRSQQALAAARALVNPGAGVLGVALGKSADRMGEAAIVVYVDEKLHPAVPATVAGVRTVLIGTTQEAVNAGTAPLANAIPDHALVPAAALAHAVQVKQQVARGLMRRTPAFFAVGVGASLDDPREAALVVYVDRSHVPAHLAAVLGGLRVRYVEMDRLHVTRSYLGVDGGSGGSARCAGGVGFDADVLKRPAGLGLE